jgi:hypothetical protein
VKQIAFNSDGVKMLNSWLFLKKRPLRCQQALKIQSLNPAIYYASALSERLLIQNAVIVLDTTSRTSEDECKW